MDVALDRIDVFDVLLDGVRVVEAQVALAAVFLRQSEVDADALGVSDMQVAVRFGRETGLYARFALGDRLFDDLFEEVQRLLPCFVCFACHMFRLLYFYFLALGPMLNSFWMSTESLTICCVPMPEPS